jgi:tight adherence protein B
MDVLAIAAAGSVVAAILSLAVAVNSASGARIRSRLEGVLSGSTSIVEGAGAVDPLRRSRASFAMIESVVSGAWLAKMQRELKQADSQLQPIDFIAIRCAMAALGFVVGYLFLGGVVGIVVALIGAAAGFVVPQLWLNQKKQGRNKKLEEQLPDALTMIANSLKSGFGLLQALNLAAEQLEEPLATELKQTVHETNVGSSTEEAFQALSDRTQSYDLDLVVTAILVQRSAGGNLSEILQTVAETMRERVRIRGEIETLTAQQKLTGIVVGLMPVGVGGMFMLISPSYITPMFTDPVGRVMLIGALILETIGVVIIRRILAIEV